MSIPSVPDYKRLQKILREAGNVHSEIDATLAVMSYRKGLIDWLGGISDRAAVDIRGVLVMEQNRDQKKLNQLFGIWDKIYGE